MVTNMYDNPNWFIDQLTLYQAANTSNAAVKQNFLIRIAEFELIMADISSKKANDPLQHELILGRRGSGKSTLLRRIQAEIEDDEILSKQYIAINLAEEQAGIYRLSDLWFEVLQELMIQLNADRPLRSFTEFERNESYTRYLYANIHEILTEHKRKVVLLLDNLDRILENFDGDGHLLRETLLNYNDLQIIGGSTRMNEHFWQYDKPFYDFFRRHRLEGLSFEEIHHLLNHWSNAMNLPVLNNYALRNRGKIEAIRIFTDGLPRALQYFIQVLLHDSTLYGFDYLKKVMDKATPLYQERLNNLTPPQRKIVLEMAFWWEASPTKVLMEKCRMEGKNISAFLKQLEGFGIVETLKTDTKNHLYRVSERFFNMWLIMTQGNPAQKRQAKYLTHFVESWYDEATLKSLATDHIAALKSGAIGYDKAMVLSKALSQSKHISVAERDALIQYTINLDEKGVFNNELPRKYSEISKEIQILFDEEKYEAALIKVEEIENEEDGVKFFIKGMCYDLQNKYKEAKKHYLLATKKGDIKALYNLAILYESKGKTAEAEKYYLLAIDKGNVYALNNLAILYSGQGKTVESEKYYLLAIDKGDIDALNNLAILYRGQGKTIEAEKYYLLAIDKGNINALCNLANLYEAQGKMVEAAKNYLLAIDKGDNEALNNLAILYKAQGKTVEAEKYYLLAIDKDSINALYNLANLYKDQGKMVEAEKYYLLAIEKGVTNALNNLAVLYYSTNQKKKETLAMIEKFHAQIQDRRANLVIIKIWNGIFDNTEAEIETMLKDSEYNDLSEFINDLLHQKQINLVLSLFESGQHGEALRTRYELLYYAALLLAGKTEGNLLLKIPPEVMPTVLDIVEKAREKQAFYGSV